MAVIYKNILKSSRLHFKEKVKNASFYLSRRKGAERSWKNRHQRVFEANNEYQKPCNEAVESEHQKLWEVFRKNVDPSTIRICKNISGNVDPRIIPEDIFVSDIEPSLLSDNSAHLFSHKSLYNQWFPEGIFPNDYLHCIEGQYYDSELLPIDIDSFKRLARQIDYPAVMKPNRDSYGGKNIFFIKNSAQLLQQATVNNNFVVQELIRQNEFFDDYYPDSLNTIRVYIYKSVQDNVAHVINLALRMGKDGSLDNLSMGGIQTLVRKDGSLNNYAVDRYGSKYEKHPNTGRLFKGRIPAVEQLKVLAIKIANRLIYARIIGLDVCLDKDGCWRAIEINTEGHSIRFAQYGGEPFLGEFTEEVIEFCVRNHWTLRKN